MLLAVLGRVRVRKAALKIQALQEKLGSAERQIRRTSLRRGSVRRPPVGEGSPVSSRMSPNTSTLDPIALSRSPSISVVPPVTDDTCQHVAQVALAVRLHISALKEKVDSLLSLAAQRSVSATDLHQWVDGLLDQVLPPDALLVRAVSNALVALSSESDSSPPQTGVGKWYLRHVVPLHADAPTFSMLRELAALLDTLET
eukprot:Sspe_Gene.92934::Locus_65677_Transcript_1_1_Confidence_1.000_Length_751::g.92934::m.92934